MSDLSSNVVPLRAGSGTAADTSSATAALRAMGVTICPPLPDCSTPLAEIASECMRFALPAYCGLCERNPANAPRGAGTAGAGAA